MKRLLIIFVRFLLVPFILPAGPVTWLLSARAWADQPVCSPLRIEENVEAAGSEITLADLLAASRCPGLRRAAAEVRVGAVPLEGTERVLDGSEVRRLLTRLFASLGTSEAEAALAIVPERITIRRAGARMSCARLAVKILARLSGATSGSAPAENVRAEENIRSQDVDCGAGDRIGEDSPVAATRSVWNAALRSWEISARCIRPADCVPFVLRIHGLDPRDLDSPPEPPGSSPARSGDVIASLVRLQRSASPGISSAGLVANAAPVVRAGETATLLWEQNGIRLQVPAVCLGPGALGDTIRARIQPGHRTLQATVTGPAMLRATP
jgi:hypothetical protein